MSNSALSDLYSIINGKTDANDKNRSFTFIEFIKEFGYDNSTNSFLNNYKNYLSAWSNAKNSDKSLSDKEYIRQSLVNTLKSIVLSYSSYEEQDFIANINWDDENHRRAIIPYFAEKIKNLCDFYKTKRQEAPLIVNKNKFKGSRTSLEQIIYDKIVDFYTGNRDLGIQVSDFKNNLNISLEQYVDIYSEYFDIPRHKKCTNESRKKFISANINTPRYEDYIKVSETITDLLFNGEVYLEEIPLIAQVGLDLSQKCAGDVSTLRDALLNEATINLISLNDQISLRRKLYEKYLGCDLYYLYCADKNNITINLLTRAQNPSGNLLNCGNSDSAVVESNELKLLSQIGLFFKPDKTGILKINADNFTWEVDKSKLTDDTFYIFPDPDKYGDIGNNKSGSYPLIYEYNLDSYIKNLSSGFAKDEPLAYISATTLNTYYSVQDRDYIFNKNEDFSYSFTSLLNKGIISNYHKDNIGIEYALFKGYKIIRDPETNDIKEIHVPSKYNVEIDYKAGGYKSQHLNTGKRNVLFNGGYFRDPRLKEETTVETAFPYNILVRLADDYIWTGFSHINSNGFIENKRFAPVATFNLGTFENEKRVKYVDHYKDKPSYQSYLSDNNKFVSCINVPNFTTKLAEAINAKKIVTVDKAFKDFEKESGEFFIKEPGKMPKIFSTAYKEENDNTVEKYYENIYNFIVVDNILILEQDKNIIFLERKYEDAINYYEVDGLSLNDNEYSNILFNESENKIIIIILEKISTGFNLKISEYDISNKHLNENIIVSDNIEKIKENFEFYNSATYEIPDNFTFVLSYNNNLDTYLLAYILETNGLPHLYQHRFRLYNEARFIDTLKSEIIIPLSIS